MDGEKPLEQTDRKTFLVSAIKLWNQLKPELKKSNTLKAFKDNVFKYYYKDQSCLAHFNP